MSKTALHTGSRLYQIVADMQGERPWGNVLDAGTGKGSLRWLLTLDTERWTAITASPGMAEQVTQELGDQKRPEDRLLVGNWSDPEFLQGERFDTVLADYLLGAIDGFAPTPRTSCSAACDRLPASVSILLVWNLTCLIAARTRRAN